MLTVIQMKRLADRFDARLDNSPAALLNNRYDGKAAFYANNDGSYFCLYDQKENRIKLSRWKEWKQGDCADAIATVLNPRSTKSDLANKIRLVIPEILD